MSFCPSLYNLVINAQSRKTGYSRHDIYDFSVKVVKQTSMQCNVQNNIAEHC